jgi:carboxylesterase type B
MDTVVRTRLGAVRGATMEGIAVFKGIPYLGTGVHRGLWWRSE